MASGKWRVWIIAFACVATLALAGCLLPEEQPHTGPDGLTWDF